MDIKDLRVIDAKGKRYILIPELMDTNSEVGPKNDYNLGLSRSSSSENNVEEKANHHLFGTLFKERRESVGITQKEISDISGVLQPNLSAIEKGSRIPRKTNQKKLIRAWEQLSGKQWNY